MGEMTPVTVVLPQLLLSNLLKNAVYPVTRALVALGIEGGWGYHSL